MSALGGDGKKVTANAKIARTSLLHRRAFGEDEAGEAYVTAFDGYVYRFRAPAPTLGPKHFRTLTETGLFTSVENHTPAGGLIPYTVNVPLSGPTARRRGSLSRASEKGQVVFKEQDQWEFPVGTVLVKTFLLNTDLENPKEMCAGSTHYLVHNSRGSWEKVHVPWNEEQDEANLLADWPLTRPFDVKTATGPVKQEWYFPSRSDCVACHTQNGGFVMGLNTRQLNRINEYGNVKDNQIRVFERLGIFSEPLSKPVRDLEAFPDWQAKTAPPATLARASTWTPDCAMCHRPGGRGHAGGAAMDMRYHVPLPEAFPGHSNWIRPGDPARSVLLKRMTMHHDNAQMPPLATNRVDEDAVNVAHQWIKQLRPGRGPDSTKVKPYVPVDRIGGVAQFWTSRVCQPASPAQNAKPSPTYGSDRAPAAPTRSGKDQAAVP